MHYQNNQPVPLKTVALLTSNSQVSLIVVLDNSFPCHFVPLILFLLSYQRSVYVAWLIREALLPGIYCHRNQTGPVKNPLVVIDHFLAIILGSNTDERR